MSSYKNRAGRDQSIADGYLRDHGTCRRCATPTEREVLSGHGGLCFPCFKAYCREAPSSHVQPHRRGEVIAKLRDAIGETGSDPKRWARELRRREQAGEPLSRVQRVAWRQALREHLEPAA